MAKAAKKRKLVLITWDDPYEVPGTWINPGDIKAEAMGPHKTAGWLIPRSEHKLPNGWTVVASTVTDHGMLGDVTCIPEALIVSVVSLEV